MKREGADRTRTEARPTQSRREVRGSYYKNKNLKLPQTGGSPGFFSPDKTKTLVRGGVQKRKTVVDKSISEGVITTSFGAGRGVSVRK